MHFQHVVCRKGQTALIAFAALPFQEFDHPHRFKGVFAQSGRPVGPVIIKNAFGANDFDVPFDCHHFVRSEGMGSIIEIDFVFEARPITSINPAYGASGMAEGRPADEHLIENTAEFNENTFGATGAVIACPADNHQVEGFNQSRLGTAPVLVNDLSQVGHVWFDGVLAWFDERLETGSLSVSSGFVLPNPILTDVKAQEIEPNPVLMRGEGVSDVGFVGIEL